MKGKDYLRYINENKDVLPWRINKEEQLFFDVEEFRVILYSIEENPDRYFAKIDTDYWKSEMVKYKKKIEKYSNSTCIGTFFQKLSIIERKAKLNTIKCK